MKHASTRALFAYWEERRGKRPAPERADIDPVAIRHALGDTFMLSADFVDELRFRLAGTRVCALFARELKGEPFTALWDEQSRRSIEELLGIVTDENTGAVAGLTGRTADGLEINLELLLLPLAHSGHARIRALGSVAALETPYWIGANAITELTLGSVRHLGGAADSGRAQPFVSAKGSEIRHGFVVYRGGREQAEKAPPNERIG